MAFDPAHAALLSGSAPQAAASSSMHKKLMALLNKFVYIRQGFFSRYYEGRLVEVTPDSISLQAYDENGQKEALWVIQLNTVTEFMVGDKDLDDLNTKVRLAETRKQLEQLLGDSSTGETEPSAVPTGAGKLASKGEEDTPPSACGAL